MSGDGLVLYPVSLKNEETDKAYAQVTEDSREFHRAQGLEAAGCRRNRSRDWRAARAESLILSICIHSLTKCLLEKILCSQVIYTIGALPDNFLESGNITNKQTTVPIFVDLGPQSEEPFLNGCHSTTCPICVTL